MNLEQKLETVRKESTIWKELIAQRDALVVAAQRGIAALTANGAPNCEAVKELRAAIAKAANSR